MTRRTWRAPHRGGGLGLHWVASLWVAALVLLGGRSAEAYPWMIQHDYTGCSTCHTDPSGSGLLTLYGRAQGDLLLRTRYGEPAEAPDPSFGFLFGTVDLPEWIIGGGYFRGLGLGVQPEGASMSSEFILMQADLQAEIQVGGFRANASIGAVSSEGSAATVSGHVVSREHWLGYSLADDTVLVRAGRLNLPFGIRSIEHTLFVRRSTRTDLNDTQQHGLAVAYSGQSLRGELMGIAGNYQMRPDEYRERGYSGYLEYPVVSWAAIGVSSLITHAERDVFLRVANTRQAHGVFSRIAAGGPLVLLLEANYIVQAPDGAPTMNGYATLTQADVEVIQGLHAIATGELADSGSPTQGFSWGLWGGLAWFFMPHGDIRFDAMRRNMEVGSTSFATTALMGQLHFYL